jgi:hypothetical protein
VTKQNKRQTKTQTLTSLPFSSLLFSSLLYARLHTDLGIAPGTAFTGNFEYAAGNAYSATSESMGCASDGLSAWAIGRSTAGTSILPEMGGKTFTPGVYSHPTALSISLVNPVVTLDAQGNPDAVFIFNAGTTLVTCAKSKIVLTGGAKAENVFWVLGTALTLGADSQFVGTVLAGSAITIGTNGVIEGKAIAQTAVTCETGCVVGPFVPPPPTSSPSGKHKDTH